MVTIANMIDRGVSGPKFAVCQPSGVLRPVDSGVVLRFNTPRRERGIHRGFRRASSLFPDVGMMARDFPLSAVDLFAALPDATCLVDSDGRIRAANEAAVLLLGIASESAPSRRMQEFCRDADREIVDRLVYRTLRFAEHDRIICQLEGATDAPRAIEIAGHQTSNPDYAVLVLRPYLAGSPEREWLEEQTRQHYRRGEEMHQTAITIGHNLKMPIVTMEANLALMERALASGQPEGIEGDLAELKSAVLRIRSMLDELLELGRLRRYDLTTLAGSLDSPPEPLDEIVAETLRLMSATIAQHTAQIEVQLSLPKARVRRRMLIEVFQNLISNALKFGEEVDQPLIQIGVEHRPEGTIAFVRDNGPGIAEEDRERVFQLFVRLNTNVSGAGAGLPIVRRILLAYQSKVWVEEGIGGRGTSICFTLPFVDDAS